MSSKSFVITNIERILKEKNLTIYKVSKEINVKDNALYEMAKGRSKFSEKFIKKLLPILEVSREAFESWIIADKYSKEVLKLAIQAKKDFPYKRKLILTTKIDDILQERGMSRTDLSKVIGYSQSGLNQIITGKRSVSKSVLGKLSVAFELSQDTILSWMVADRHSLAELESALQVE